MIDGRRITYLIDLHLDDWRFCVESLSDMLEVSPSYLREIIRREYRLRPYELIRRRRLERAVQLLCDCHHCNEVYDKVGFNNPRTFRRAFLAHFGVTPSEYKARLLASTRGKNPAKKYPLAKLTGDNDR